MKFTLFHICLASWERDTLCVFGVHPVYFKKTYRLKLYLTTWKRFSLTLKKYSIIDQNPFILPLIQKMLLIVWHVLLIVHTHQILVVSSVVSLWRIDQEYKFCSLVLKEFHMWSTLVFRFLSKFSRFFFLSFVITIFHPSWVYMRVLKSNIRIKII